MTHTVYVKINQITELTHKDVTLKDVAEIYCDDSHILSRCGAMKIMTVREDRKKRYVISTTEIIKKLSELDPSIEVNSIGEADFIVAYKPPAPPSYLWQWMKTIFVCFICFFGGAFAIMTFNNDASVTDVFSEVYKLVMGKESTGFSVLEISYSVGLTLGIILFFNHVAAIKLNTDPTPLEVEMRLYEDNISKTLIADAGRKESKIDVT